MSAAAIEKMVAQGRFDHQIALVREYWTSVRRLWLGAAGARAARVKSDLPDDFLLGCGMPGLANILPTPGDHFDSAESGLTAVILPVFDTIPGLVGTRVERHVEELRDLVAVDLDHPDRFWRRRGNALILGNAFLEIAGQELAPVPVFRDPVTWLCNGGAGIAVLDWDYARDLLLDHQLIAEDIELGDRLQAALKPDIWVMETAA